MLMGYNITRNGTKINTYPITAMTYPDVNVPSGQYTYCVSAIYDLGESPDSCNTVEVAVGMAQGEQPALLVYPNPAHGMIVVKTSGGPAEITVTTMTGNTIMVSALNIDSNQSTLDISDLPAGIYFISVISRQGLSRTKLVVY